MTDPLEIFKNWLEEARSHPAITEPTAMTLATATPAGIPSARVVLLKEVDARGLVFYTNLESRKSAEIKQNPSAALCFYWMALERQVRIEGKIEAVSGAQADAYFASRARGSQIGAWASSQSRPMAGRGDFLQSIEAYTKQFEGSPVPRPPHWSGWRVVPDRIEFWQQGDSRLHIREVFCRTRNDWEKSLLYP